MRKYIGDKDFYKSVLLIAVPIMIQQGITNFVGMLDNIMIGQVGTTQMTGVAIANQLIFVFNLCIFGAVSGAGIFTAQYYGTGDTDGVRHTFRFKILICAIITALGILLLFRFGENLILLYLKGEGSVEDLSSALFYGKQYLRVMMIGLLPFALGQSYSGTLRETGDALLPMKAGVTGVLVNLCLNYILIFGNFGAPKLGVEGAAIATVIARFTELSVVAFFSHFHKSRYPFVVGLYRNLWEIPGELVKDIAKKGIPLLFNETIWAAGVAVLNQCYSLRGLEVVAAVNIQATVWNVFAVSFMAMGNAVGIIVGQILGMGDLERVRDTDRKLIAFSVFSSVLFAIALVLVAKWFPYLYNTTDSIRELATGLIIICAVVMPLDAYLNAAYFTIRAGGKTFAVFVFDSGFNWAVMIPAAFFLSRFTVMPILPLFLCCQALNIIKCIVGYMMLKKGVWIQNLVKK